MFFVIQQGLPAAHKLERQFTYQFPGKESQKEVMFSDESYCQIEYQKDRIDITSFVTFNCRKESKQSVIYTEVLTIHNYRDPKKLVVEVQWFDARIKDTAVLMQHTIFERNKSAINRVESMVDANLKTNIPFGMKVGNIEVDANRNDLCLIIPFEHWVPVVKDKLDPKADWEYELFSLSSYEILVETLT